MKRLTWGEFARGVLALYEPPIRRKSTHRKMRQVLDEFGRHCRHCRDLTPETIAAWIAEHPGRRPSTVATLLSSLRAACNYAISRGWLKTNPFQFRAPREWIDPDVPELPPPVHTGEEIAAVLRQADSEASGGCWRAARLRAVLYSSAYTGARKREIMGLRVEDVDLELQVLRIRTNSKRPLKTRKSSANLPIPAPLAYVLAEWIPLASSEWLFPGSYRLGPWFDGAPGYRPIDELKALGKRAGVEGLTFQSLRHSFASLSEGWGIGELMLQRLLRHTSIRTQRGYRHPLSGALVEAAAKVRFG